MVHLQKNDSLATYIQSLLFELGAILFSDGDKDLGEDLEKELRVVETLQIEGLKLANENLKLTAGQRMVLHKVRKAAEELEAADTTFRKSPAGNGAKSIFPHTVAAIFVMKQADRDAGLAAVHEKAEGRMPDVMKGAAKRFGDKMKELQDVQKQLAELTKRTKQWSDRALDAKAGAMAAEVRLEGGLLYRHSKDPAVVELYFRPSPAVPKKKDGEEPKPPEDPTFAAAPAPAPGPVAAGTAGQPAVVTAPAAPPAAPASEPGAKPETSPKN